MNMQTTSRQRNVTRQIKRRISALSLSLLFSVLIILLLAAAIRFHNLGTQSFWNDEGSSYVQSLRTFPDIAANAARDIHPPGYYWLLAIWRNFVGESEFALRSFSTFASLLTVAFTFSIARRLFNPVAGITAAIFVALNSFSIYYAQEARMYALLGLWSAAGIWALLRLLSHQSPAPSPQLSAATSLNFFSRFWKLLPQYSVLSTILLLALINAAGLYTQYAYPFIMLAQGVIFLIFLLSRFIRTRTSVLSTSSSFYLLPFAFYLLANLLTIVLYLPWLPTALHQITTWPSTGQPIPPTEAISTILGYFTFGITYADVRSADTYIPLALLFLIAGLGIWFWLRGRRMLWRMAVPLIWALLPVVLFLALGLFRPANLKFLLPSQIGFALLMGAGVGGWWTLAESQANSGRVTRLFAALQTVWLLAYLFNGLPPLYDDPRYRRPDYRAMVTAITADPRSGDAIILDAPNQEEVFRYYYRAAAPVYALPPGLGGDDAETRAAVEGIINDSNRIFVLFWGEAERDPNHIVETTLDNGAFEAGQDTWYGDVRFARYAAPQPMLAPVVIGARFGDLIRLDRYALNARSLLPGDVLQIQLEWRAESAIPTRYKVFIQLLTEGGVLVAQRDAEPVGNTQPTTSWAVGETIIDRHGLALPPDLAPGNYLLIAGLYNIDDGTQRLPTVAGRDYLPLANITVR